MLLGLPLVRRTTLAASRAGFDRVYVLGADETPELPPGRIVLLPDRVAASPEWLRSLREAPAEPGRLYRVGAGAMVETLEPAPLSRPRSGLSSVLSEWAAAFPRRAPRRRRSSRLSK